jgi:hypothetical protein
VTARRAGRALLTVLAALVTVLAWLAASAGPAAAHGGDLVVEVAGDGGNGIGLVATWKDDGHPVGPEVRFDMTASRAGGPAESVGPLEVPLSNEGSGFRSLPNVLTAGEWTVTVVATGAGVTADTPGARTEVAVTVPEDAVPSATTGGGTDDPDGAGTAGEPAPGASAAAAPTGAASTRAAAGSTLLVVLVVLVAVLAAGAVIALAVRSRHRPVARRRA